LESRKLPVSAKPLLVGLRYDFVQDGTQCSADVASGKTGCLGILAADL
jgi:hypothetical protein